MKFIDEKGRIFGTINIIDLGLLFVLALIIGTMGYKFVGKPIEQSISADTTEVVARIKCQNTEAVAKALESSFKAGDPLFYGAGKINGTLEAVSYKDSEYTVLASDGRLVLATDPIRKDIFVTVKFEADIDGPVIKHGTQEVRVGKGYWIKTKMVELSGTIEHLEIK